MLGQTALALSVATFACQSHAWMPGHKIRGVNVGTWQVFEPWIDNPEWERMGCGGQQSEFDCVMKLGQNGANSAFRNHWDSWLGASDLDEMMSYGLNTVRIPLGYWLKEDLIDSSEHFPRGGLDSLTKFVGLASDRGFYVILDLHGGPGAQVPKNPFTGQYAPSAGFYNDYNYDRAVEWLRWITEIKHTTNEYRNVGMIELINEPLAWNEAVGSLRSSYYVKAYNAIRDVERSLGVASNDMVHIQMMSELWGSGNPTEFLSDTHFTAFDDHRYLKWSDVPTDKNSYLSTSCGDDRNAEEPLIMGEWSLSVPDSVQWTDAWNPYNDVAWYKRWFTAQIQAYERSTEGWVFWTWKSGLGDPRWDYRRIIDRDIQSMLNTNVCG